MPFLNLPDGLYLIRRPGGKTGKIDHYGILDIGNMLRHPQATGEIPLVIHQTPPEVRIDWVTDIQPASCLILGRVPNHELPMAISRVKEASKNRYYDLFTDNCEQFARYVAEGSSYSTQLQAATLLSVVALTAITVFEWD